MKAYLKNSLRSLSALAAGALMLASCNKPLPEATPLQYTLPPFPGPSILETIRADAANFSILDSAIKRAGAAIRDTLNSRTGVFTFFAPTNAAFAASGIPNVTALSAFTPAQLTSILNYHIVPGRYIPTDSIPTTFPNRQLPTSLVIAPASPTLPPGLRNSVFLSRRGTMSWVNNVPITTANAATGNGIIHRIGAVLLPPSQLLWDRINTGANLTYLKAAIQRADSGVVAASTLQAALQNPAANLTVFAPNDAAFQALLTGQITQALVLQGVPLATAQATAQALAATPDVFTNPALWNVLTPTTVRGLIAYHVLGTRAFTVNLPTTATNFQTLLNGVIPTHPGVSIAATFATPPGFSVSAATVRGAANPSASNIQINPTPAPGGSSDQNYVNGIIHIIDQVLRPQ